MGVTRPPIHVTADAVLSMHPVDKASAVRFWKGTDLPEADGKSGLPFAIGRATRPIKRPLPRQLTACSSKKTWTSSSFPCSIRKTSPPAAILPTA